MVGPSGCDRSGPWMTEALKAELLAIERGRKKDRILGLAVVLVAFTVCLALFLLGEARVAA